MVPNWKDPGDPIGAFAVAVFKDGTYQCKVMSVREIEEIRKRGAARGAEGPWVTDWGAMATKTAIKQLCKLLPMSLTDERMSKAMDVDDVAEEEDIKALSAPSRRGRNSKEEKQEQASIEGKSDDVSTDEGRSPLDELADMTSSGDVIDGEILSGDDDAGNDAETWDENDDEDPTSAL